MNSLSIIFSERPEQWGLRGDPYLWDDLENHFSNTSLPYPVEKFITELNNLIKLKTGSELSNRVDTYVEKYAHGGMSSGMVCNDFWVQTAIPLLTLRLKKQNECLK